MVKSDNNKMQVYSKVDKKELKKAIKLLIVAAIMSLIFFCIDSNIITIFSLCLANIVLLISIIIYKNISEEPKLQVVLTKEYIEVYRKKETFRCNMEKIISFSCDQSTNSLNEVFINYKNEKNKKKTKIFILRGMHNREFINIANGVLNNKDIIKDSEILKEKDYEEDFNKENVFGNIAKILCFVGKEKLVTTINNQKNVDNMENVLYFLDKDGKEFKLYWQNIKMEKDLKLKTNKFYTVKYDEKNKYYKITDTNFKFDLEIINEYKNKIHVSNILIFDDKIINEEIELLAKFDKYRVNYIYIMFLIINILLMITIFKKEMLILILIKIIPMGLFFSLVIFGIIVLNIINKIKKIEN